jgi:hypothetical protein
MMEICGEYLRALIVYAVQSSGQRLPPITLARRRLSGCVPSAHQSVTGYARQSPYGYRS